MNKSFFLAIGVLLAGITTVAQQTTRPCCEIPSCREKAEGFAVKLAGLAAYAGPFKQSDNAANKESLDQLKKDHPDIHDEFIRTSIQVHRFINETRQGTCFMDALPEESFEDIYGWISYINDPQNPPKFPSAEYCKGWRRRFEISQGAASFLHNEMTWIGSLRGYLIYTFGGKDECGNPLRIMAGPGYFLRHKTSYLTMSNRLAVRIKDLAPKNFAIGNMSAFGGFDTNFGRFNLLSLGGEVELGTFGVNISVNHDLNRGHQGFLIGIIWANKNLVKAKS